MYEPCTGRAGRTGRMYTVYMAKQMAVKLPKITCNKGRCMVYTDRTYQVRNNIKVTETRVPLNATMAPQLYVIT